MKYLLTVFGEVCTILILNIIQYKLHNLQTRGKTFIFYFQILHVVVKFTANLYLNHLYVGIFVSLITFLSLQCHSLLF